MKRPKSLKGGLADKAKTKPSQVDQKQLKMGIKVESEHTNDPQIAKQISLDHLTEIKDYYSRLKKMEQSAAHLDHPQIKSK